MQIIVKQQLGLIHTTGGRLSLTLEQFLNIYRSPRTQLYLGLVCVIFVATDPNDLHAVLPFGAYVLATFAGQSVYLGCQILVLTCCAILRGVRPSSRIYWPMITLLSLGPTIVIMKDVLVLVEPEIQFPVMSRLVFLAVTVLVFEMIFLRFVLPVVCAEALTGTPLRAGEAPPLPDATAPEPEPSDPEPDTKPPEEEERVVVIGGRPVPLRDLTVVEAREHHVHVHLDGTSLVQRARLSDVVAQTRAEDGVQPHRSWWVARHAVCALDRDGPRPILRLADGSTVPVARGRLPDVERWLEAYLG